MIDRIAAAGLASGAVLSDDVVELRLLRVLAPGDRQAPIRSPFSLTRPRVPLRHPPAAGWASRGPHSPADHCGCGDSSCARASWLRGGRGTSPEWVRHSRHPARGRPGTGLWHRTPLGADRAGQHRFPQSGRAGRLRPGGRRGHATGGDGARPRAASVSLCHRAPVRPLLGTRVHYATGVISR